MPLMYSKRIYDTGKNIIGCLRCYRSLNVSHGWKYWLLQDSIKKRGFFTAHDLVNRNKDYTGRQLVGYSMEQMFSVVADVGNYYKFVPWCKKSVIIKPGTTNLQADLVIGFPPINESYTSNVTMKSPHLVKAVCTEGKLFNHLLTLWRFSPGLKDNPQSCVVDFQVSFEFRSVLHLQLTNIFFNQVVKQMEGAFIDEVRRRYGRPSVAARNLLKASKS